MSLVNLEGPESKQPNCDTKTSFTEIRSVVYLFTSGGGSQGHAVGHGVFEKTNRVFDASTTLRAYTSKGRNGIIGRIVLALKICPEK